MEFKYLGQVSYSAALEAQSPGCVLGFECDPVITLGVRGFDGDLLWPLEEYEQSGFAILKTDRGGQATLHNPGQLVIFPTLDVRPYGARKFVGHLIEASRIFLKKWGVESRCRSGEPGLYTDSGKIMSIGLRIQKGIAHHGIAINIDNDLAPFSGISVCGQRRAPVDRMRARQKDLAPLPALFLSWAEEFKAQLTSRPISTNLCAANPDVRS